MIQFKHIAVAVMFSVSHISNAATSCSTITEETKRLKCYDSANKKSSMEHKKDQSELDAQNAVLKRLKDPDSAKFGQFTKVEDKACLTVNAKNSLGGYIGDQQAVLMKAEDIWLVATIEKKLSHNKCIEAISIN